MEDDGGAVGGYMMVSSEYSVGFSRDVMDNGSFWSLIFAK